MSRIGLSVTGTTRLATTVAAATDVCRPHYPPPFFLDDFFDYSLFALHLELSLPFLRLKCFNKLTC